MAGIHAVDLAHQAGQIGLAGLNHQVVMITHQAVSENFGVEALQGLAENGQKCPVVHIALAIASRLSPLEVT